MLKISDMTTNKLHIILLLKRKRNQPWRAVQENFSHICLQCGKKKVVGKGGFEFLPLIDKKSGQNISIHVTFLWQKNWYILVTHCFINYCLNVDTLPLIYLLVLICCMSKCDFFQISFTSSISLEFYVFCILRCS